MGPPFGVEGSFSSVPADQAMRVLIVDHSALMCDMLCTFGNTHADLQCSALTNMKELFTVVELWKPRVVVLDMTGESPLDMMRLLFRKHPGVRVIAYSGYDDDSTLDQVFKAGGWGLVKKVGDVNLFDVVRRVGHA